MCIILYIQVPKGAKMGSGASVAGNKDGCEPPDVGTVKYLAINC